MNSVLGYLPGHTHSLDWRQQNPAPIFVMPPVLGGNVCDGVPGEGLVLFGRQGRRLH